MERKIIFGILFGSLIAFAIGMLIPSGETVRKVNTPPWQIELLPDGATKVLGLTLGRSTLADAQAVVGDEPEMNLFKREDGSFTVEAFFEVVWVSGLKASMVVGLELQEADLEGMYKRGLRITKLGSGSSRVTLTAEDGRALAHAPITLITYMPKARLDEALLISRFGEPAERLEEPKSGVVHLLYPEKGLDIGHATNDKVVIQYVHPARFGEVVAPLDTAER